MNVPLQDQLACAKRELALRRAVYPKRVAEHRMKQEDANREIERMAAIVATIERLIGFEGISNEMAGRTTQQAQLL